MNASHLGSDSGSTWLQKHSDREKFKQGRRYSAVWALIKADSRTVRLGMGVSGPKCTCLVGVELSRPCKWVSSHASC